MSVLEQETQRERPRRRHRLRWTALIVVIAAVAVGGVVGMRWWQSRSAAIVGERERSFPAVDESRLNDTQIRIVDTLKREFQAQPPGTKYAEGNAEAWCADFVSWVMRDAGQPLSNPNSGSWRIPGVYTLETYFRGQNRLQEANSGYQPRVGDVVLYGDASPFHQHTNIVVADDGNTLTTVGGNEMGEVRIHKYRIADISGLAGYGVLGTR
ncbi:CHAP domain-containing protein [Nocardia sp. NPDC088792]|uniref:CHAP domain-containing protein n=1 Tax=Nocardia sp. NPDC088792 TaxID=3364332 RepID=UPI00380E76BD